MTAFVGPQREVDGPGFDRQRLSPDRIPRVLELTSTLCAMNEQLSRRTGPHPSFPLTRPDVPADVADQRRALLEELHRLITG
jgi:hypothetical protein